MDPLVERHRRACDGFLRVAQQVDDWDAPTPCTEWDARALVEHVIGFHEFLLLRPLGIRARRPRVDPAARLRITQTALFDALDEEGVLDRATELPGGGTRTPRTMLDALTTDVLVHTWDLATAAQLDPRLDDALVRRIRLTDMARKGALVGPAVAVPDDVDPATKLVAWYGRDPRWTPPAPR